MALPPLRAWQIEAQKKWVSAGSRGIVEVVTGGGKTLFALACMHDWLKTQDQLGHVLVIVPTTALQDQWLLTLTMELGIPREKIAVWPDTQHPEAQFHIMVINTARTRSLDLVQAKSPWFLIADECHRYGSDRNALGIAIPVSASLGLTATAERDFDDGLFRYVIPSLGPIIYKYELRQALQDGVITPFKLVNVETDLNSEEADEYRRLGKAVAMALGSGDEEKARRLSIARSRVSKCAVSRIPTAIALVEKERTTKTIVFHEDITSVDAIAEILRRRGTRARAYHSRISADMRRDNLRMFFDDQIDVLVACRALDEGLDVPGAERAIIAASTSSTRQRIQRIGRVLRRSDEKEMASVFTIFATESEAERLSRESSNLEDVSSVEWLKVTRA